MCLPQLLSVSLCAEWRVQRTVLLRAVPGSPGPSGSRSSSIGRLSSDSAASAASVSACSFSGSAMWTRTLISRVTEPAAALWLIRRTTCTSRCRAVCLWSPRGKSFRCMPRRSCRAERLSVSMLRFSSTGHSSTAGICPRALAESKMAGHRRPRSATEFSRPWRPWRLPWHQSF